MKTVTSLIVGCALTLAGTAFAQQPDEQQPPPGKKKPQHAEKAPGGGGKPGPAPGNAPHGAAIKQHGPPNEAHHPQGIPNAQEPREKPAITQHNKAKVHAKEAGNGAAAASNVNAAPTTEASSPPVRNTAKHHGKQERKDVNTPVADQNATPGSTPITVNNGGKKNKGAKNTKTASAPETAPTAAPSAAASVAPVNQPKGEGKRGVAAKKPDPEQVQQIRQQHENFRAQPKPDKVPAVTFNQNYRIQGSDRWQGPQYETYRSYRPERHDQGWYRSHYSRVELVGGGYYYWNNGYWYPAWGYDPRNEYYAYDAPIYVGRRAVPPDQVIADVQAELQSMGYYRGEVDGLLGPLTREALTAYQSDQGLYTTAVIDEPTLDALGMG